MLCLSRKSGQSILIGDDIRVTVVLHKGNTVRVAIEAPKELHIKRSELVPKVSQEQVQCSNG